MKFSDGRHIKMSDDLVKLLCIRLKNQLGISKLSDDSSSVKSHSRITFIG